MGAIQKRLGHDVGPVDVKERVRRGANTGSEGPTKDLLLEKRPRKDQTRALKKAGRENEATIESEAYTEGGVAAICKPRRLK